MKEPKCKQLKHSCGSPHCNRCRKKCVEYLVAKRLMDEGFARIEGKGFVKL